GRDALGFSSCGRAHHPAALCISSSSGRAPALQAGGTGSTPAWYSIILPFCIFTSGTGAVLAARKHDRQAPPTVGTRSHPQRHTLGAFLCSFSGGYHEPQKHPPGGGLMPPTKRNRPDHDGTHRLAFERNKKKIF